MDKTKLIQEALLKVMRVSINNEIKIKLGNEWAYDNLSNEVVVKTDSLLHNNWKYNLANIFILIGQDVLTKTPKDYVRKLDKKGIQVHSFALSSMEELRIQNLMPFNFPGVKSFFRKAYEYDSNNITKKDLEALPKHQKFIYDIREYFFTKKISKNIKPYIKYIDMMINSDSTEKLINIFNENLLEVYFSLYGNNKDDKSTAGLNDLLDDLKSKKQKTLKQIEEENEDLENELMDIVGFDKEHEQKGNPVNYNDLYNDIYHLIFSFVKKFGTILKDNSYNRFGGNFRTGRLNTNRLYKVELNDSKIFNRKIDRRHKNYIVSLLIDKSFSMNGEKENLAIRAAVLMSEVLNKLNIEFEIIGFNINYNVIKSFSQKFDYGAKRRMGDTFMYGYEVGGNNDGYAIRKANESLLKYSKPGTERIMVVLSDGNPQPSGFMFKSEFGKTRYEDFNLSEEVEFVSKYTKIIGIGIQDDAVQKYYKDNIVINDINLLPEILLNKLKNNIKRG